MNNNNQKNTTDKILEKIKSGKVHMHSRLRFVLTHILLVLAAVVTLALAVFLLSFILFAIRGSGVWFLPFLGLQGIGSFILVFPWVIFLIAITAIIIFEYLIKNFSFSYRKPLLYTAIGSLVLALIFSFIAEESGIHDRLYYSSRYRRLPFLGSMHTNFTSKLSKRALFGTILKGSKKEFTLKLKNGEELEVITFKGSPFPFNEELSPGSYVFVAGEKANGTIRAFRVYKVPEERVKMFIPGDDNEMPVRRMHK